MDREHRDEREQENFMESDVEGKGEKEFRRTPMHPDMEHVGDTDCEVKSYWKDQVAVQKTPANKNL